MPQNDQATSNPYRSDNLATRDQRLVWAKEFGTNVTADLGTIFDSSGGDGSPFPITAIDARFGRLTMNSFNMSQALQSWSPKARMFPFPYFDLFPATELQGQNPHLGVLYTHVTLMQESHGADPEPPDEDLQPSLGVILGGDDCTGSNGAAPFAGVFFQYPPREFMDIREPGQILGVEYEDGGGDPTSYEGEGGSAAFLCNIYLRFTMVVLEIDPGKFAGAMIPEWSRDGLGWQVIGEQVEFDITDGVPTQIGFCTRGPLIAAWDWARAYSYQPEDVFDPASGGWGFKPIAPFTGGRIFTP